MAFGYFKSATQAESQSGTADSTDWPLTISLDGNVQAADADLKTVGNGGYVQNANGYDIRPYADSGLTTPLTFQIRYFDGTTGKLEMHVKIPTLSTSTDTVIYLAFGDSGISTDGSSSSTWDSNFEGVYHLADGSTVDATDSTSNANNGTNNSATATAGQIDGGIATNGSSQYVDLGTPASLEVYSGMTISAWIKRANQGGSEFAVAKDFSTGARGWGLGTTNFVAETRIYVEWGGSAVVIGLGAIQLNDGVYHQIAFTESGGTLTPYNDGVTATGAVVSSLTANSGASTYIGGRAYVGFFNGFAGSIDEVRIESTVRSQSWITATYNAQKSSSTFITWGTLTPVAGGGVVKTINGTAISVIKTINGTAVTGVKTYNGAAYQ